MSFRNFSTLTFTTKYHSVDPKILIAQTLPRLLGMISRMSSEFYLGIELTDKGIVHYHLCNVVTNGIKYKLFKQHWIKYGFACHKVLPDDNRQWADVRKYCLKDHLALMTELYPNYIHAECIYRLNWKEVKRIIKNPLLNVQEIPSILKWCNNLTE